jgi:hypothetical protein
VVELLRHDLKGTEVAISAEAARMVNPVRAEFKCQVAFMLHSGLLSLSEWRAGSGGVVRGRTLNPSWVVRVPNQELRSVYYPSLLEKLTKPGAEREGKELVELLAEGKVREFMELLWRSAITGQLEVLSSDPKYAKAERPSPVVEEVVGALVALNLLVLLQRHPDRLPLHKDCAKLIYQGIVECKNRLDLAYVLKPKVEAEQAVAVVIEVKRADKACPSGAYIESLVNAAIEQIKDKGYARHFLGLGCKVRPFALVVSEQGGLLEVQEGDLLLPERPAPAAEARGKKRPRGAAA